MKSTAIVLTMLACCAFGLAQEPQTPPKTTAPSTVRPSSLYGEELGVASRKKLKEELKKLRVQMGVMNRAAKVIDETGDGSPRGAIVENLIKLKVLESLSKGLPIAARGIESYRWDVWLRIDRCDSESARLEARAVATRERMTHLVDAILDAEERGGSQVRIDTMRNELDQRLAQYDSQNRDAEEAKRIAAALRDEVKRLKTLDELLDGIANEKGVYAERLLEGIEREVAIPTPKQIADGINEINDMIGLISSSEKDVKGQPKVKRSIGPNTETPSVAAEVEALKAATQLKDPQRVESVLEKARQARKK